MRFVYVPFGGTAPPAAVACDGLVAGAALDLSHWSHNRTPVHLKADTSVEIALAFARERGEHDVRNIANNHFDTDGVLAVWTLLSPEIALAHAPTIIAAAESGDFSEWPRDERGLWLDAAITKLAGVFADAQAYARLLPMLDDLVPAIDGREDLWGEAYRELLEVERSIDDGRISIAKEGRVAVCRHAPREREIPGEWISRRRPAGTDRVLLAFEQSGRFQYRYELPRYAWADTVVRRKLEMPRRGPIKRALGRAWVIKGRRGMTGISYTAEPVELDPATVARTLADLESAAA
jgi:uncharacterized protein DUF6687